MLTILCGDALTELRKLESESVQCCVTSPPYWGLRDYGTAKWEGGDANCRHLDDDKLAERMRQKKSMIVAGEKCDGSTRTRIHDEELGKEWQYRGACLKCGATRTDSQLGLEPTPAAYVARMVQVFNEVRRVLRENGTLWLNLGDSYSGGGQNSGSNPEDLTEKQRSNGGCRYERRPVPKGLKPKDLIGIPWRVALALQADGWWLRSDIIWAKPNPMPESVTDRPTKAHEYLFLMAKSQKYYYDVEAIKEPAETEPHNSGYVNGEEYAVGPMNRGGNSQREDPDRVWAAGGLRNRRSVWTVNPMPYKEAHFATFPPDLIKPCILAGTKPGDVVLDPFGGSGTTGMVALELGRKAILIELNPQYCALAERRCHVTPGLAL